MVPVGTLIVFPSIVLGISTPGWTIGFGCRCEIYSVPHYSLRSKYRKTEIRSMSYKYSYNEVVEYSYSYEISFDLTILATDAAGFSR